MSDPADVLRLQQAIRDLHGCDSRHLGSAIVHETFQGQPVWDGEVEIFELTGHPTAKQAYAWSHETDEGGRRYVAVLQVPPVNTPVDAVRAAIVAESKSRQERD
jgi:hypothetical protein